MIAINNNFVATEEELNSILEIMDKDVYNNKTRKAYNVFEKFLREYFKYDQRLTKMVQENLGEDLVPIVNVDNSDIADPNEFHFYLASTDENRVVSKRDERKYYEYCDICFGGVEGFFDRFIVEFSEE